jgi:hypothetical protein
MSGSMPEACSATQIAAVKRAAVGPSRRAGICRSATAKIANSTTAIASGPN